MIERKNTITEDNAKKLYLDDFYETKTYYEGYQASFKTEHDIVAELINEGGYRNGYGVTKEQFINHVQCLINKERCIFTDEEKILCDGNKDAIYDLRILADNKDQFEKNNYKLVKVIAVFLIKHSGFIKHEGKVRDYLNTKWGTAIQSSNVSNHKKNMKSAEQLKITELISSLGEEISKSA